MSAKTIDDGGPVYPHDEKRYAEHNDKEYTHHYGGETRRQALARCAMQGLCANPSVFASNAQCGWKLVNCDEDQLTMYCFMLADKQIAFEARERAEMEQKK